MEVLSGTNNAIVFPTSNIYTLKYKQCICKGYTQVPD